MLPAAVTPRAPTERVQLLRSGCYPLQLPLAHPLSEALFDLVAELALDCRPCEDRFRVSKPPTERVAVNTILLGCPGDVNFYFLGATGL